MKKSILTITMALAVALPMLTVSSQAEWYTVWHEGGLAIKSEHGANGPRGRLKCNVPTGEFVHRDNNDSSVESRGWIYVRWKKPSIWTPEWAYKDTRGKWCPDWNRHGWVEKRVSDFSNTDSKISKNGWR